MAGKTVDGFFKGNSGDVFEACRRATANLGLPVLTSSRESLTISFRKDLSFKAVGGQDLMASIFDEDGSSWVVGGGASQKAEISMAVRNLRVREIKALSNKFLHEVNNARCRVSDPDSSNRKPQAD